MDDEHEIHLPESIEQAWGVRERPRKGPKRGLSQERIIAAAVQVAERDGLAAVSMSRVAAELGASAMSLYRYFAAKDELLALMADAVYGPPSLDWNREDGWRAGMSRWAWGTLRSMRRHPWVLRIPISGPPTTPNVVLWLERGLQCLQDTGLTEAEKMSVILLVSGYVRNDATISTDIATASRAAGGSEQEIMPVYGRILTKLIDPYRFPALTAVIASGIFNVDDDPDDEFTFGLERILDGIEVLVRERTSTAVAPTVP
ncbi:MAG TPA: TetR/AcrR family transcriptional regulator [Nitrolancea sp.]|nr:TetR/AcrR family transcriptional regulator [Nitrolancea sp.]